MKQKLFYQNVDSITEQWLPNKDQKLNWTNIISPYKIDLPMSVYSQAQTLIDDIFKLKYNENYSQSILSESGYKKQNQHSVLMAYDFHYFEDQLKLIEVNTNASGYLLSHLTYMAQNINNKNVIPDLKASFEEEYELFYKQKCKSPKVVIIDEDPKNQKMYIEFLMFKKQFEDWGWLAKVLNYSDQLDNFDFVYNRYCDFDFSKTESKHLKEYYVNQQLCFSPHPVEYLLFAHKDRFIDWTSASSLLTESTQKMIPKTFKLSDYTDKEKLWAERKKLFFKPRFSYGGKGVYNGKSISRKAFDAISDAPNYMAQETCLPGKVNFDNQDWKYDLRFYVYKNKIQQVITRLYQGQVTNFNTDYGGFCPVHFSS